MSTYYCHDCGMSLGVFSPIDPDSNLTGSAYTLEKYLKHTIPPVGGNIVSIFNSSSYDAYKSYIVNTSASGSVEVDDQNRVNIVWAAGRPTGFTYINGILQGPVDGVKVVLHSDTGSIHAFPTGSNGFTTRVCANCAKPISGSAA